jgi:hypothetical protein
VTFLTLRRTPDMVAGRCGYGCAVVCVGGRRVLIEVEEDHYSRYPGILPWCAESVRIDCCARKLVTCLLLSACLSTTRLHAA